MIDLALVKQHLRVVHDDDNNYLHQLCQAAVVNFEQFTGRHLVPATTESAELAEYDCWLTADITQGLLMRIGQWYENRELPGDKNLVALPAATVDLWSPYVLFHLGDARV